MLEIYFKTRLILFRSKSGQPEHAKNRFMGLCEGRWMLCLRLTEIQQFFIAKLKNYYFHF